MVDAALYLRDNRIVRRVYIREQLIKRFVDKHAHHAGVSVVPKHPAVLPHSISPRLLACSRIVNRVQRGESNASAKSVAADHNIRAGRVLFTCNIVFSIHNKNLDGVCHYKIAGRRIHLVK